MEIHHECTLEKPILKLETGGVLSGGMSRQVYVDKIPYENLFLRTSTPICLQIKSFDEDGEVAEMWQAHILDDKIVINAPVDMEYEFPRNQL